MPKQVSYVKSSGGGFFKPEAGGYPAIIVGVIELGTEAKDYKDDGNLKDVEEIRLVYEIEAEQEETEKNDKDEYVPTGEKKDVVGTIGQNYTTIVSDNSKLGKVIKAIYDVDSMDEIKGFSLDKLLGLKCYIDVDLVGKKKNFPVVKSATALNKKFETMLHETAHEPFYFGMDDADDFIEDWEEDLKKHMPSWEVDRIKASKEYRSLMEKFGIEVPVSLAEDEKAIEKELEEKRASKPQPTTEDAEDIFADEPEV